MEIKWKIPSYCTKPIQSYKFEIADTEEKSYKAFELPPQIKMGVDYVGFKLTVQELLDNKKYGLRAGSSFALRGQACSKAGQ